MVRYELILRRYPKLKAAEVPQRMGDLPDEFSEGTLQSALENPEGGPVPIAWGDRRKRLLLIQRRIEILGGSAELIDRSGPVAKWFTEHSDALKARWLKPPSARKQTVVDPTQLSLTGLGFGASLVAGLIAFAQLAHDVHARAHALQVAGFVSGWLMSRLFVRGVRRWFTGDGHRALAAGLVLLPISTLCWAGYQAHALGLVDQSVALLRGESTQARKPTMKPFAALLAELHRRKQREELAAALASELKSKASAKAAAAPPAAQVAQPETPVSPSPAAVSGQRKTAMKSTQTKHASTASMQGAQPVVRAGLAPPCEEPPVFPANVDEVVALKAPPPVVKHVVKPLTVHPPRDVWGPLRSVGDVNEIHVAIALLLAAATFSLGLWVGRRARRKAGAGQELAHGATRADDATPVVPGELPVVPASLAPQPRAAANGVASVRPAAAPELGFEPDTSRSLPLITSDLLGTPANAEREWTPDAPLPPVERHSHTHAQARVTQPPLKPDGAAPPARDSAVGGQARKPDQRRAGAYSTRGGIQEELVTRRRDARRDD